ncbi:MAG: hypothetical protein SV686_02170 [Thermodesulfobacteriota bacterium]|jgi:hypothetical protein|nr:hypothetical protein [Thermodesulfobacteriota bacterium]
MDLPENGLHPYEAEGLTIKTKLRIRIERENMELREGFDALPRRLV